MIKEQVRQTNNTKALAKNYIDFVVAQVLKNGGDIEHLKIRKNDIVECLPDIPFLSVSYGISQATMERECIKYFRRVKGG